MGIFFQTRLNQLNTITANGSRRDIIFQLVNLRPFNLNKANRSFEDLHRRNFENRITTNVFLAKCGIMMRTRTTSKRGCQHLASEHFHDRT
jgi:hypothetical protein